MIWVDARKTKELSAEGYTVADIEDHFRGAYSASEIIKFIPTAKAPEVKKEPKKRKSKQVK